MSATDSIADLEVKRSEIERYQKYISAEVFTPNCSEETPNVKKEYIEKRVIQQAQEELTELKSHGCDRIENCTQQEILLQAVLDTVSSNTIKHQYINPLIRKHWEQLEEYARKNKIYLEDALTAMDKKVTNGCKIHATIIETKQSTVINVNTNKYPAQAEIIGMRIFDCFKLPRIKYTYRIDDIK